MIGDGARQLTQLYPKIYFACHTRHVRDPLTSRLVSSHQASILDHLDETEATLIGDLARHMGVTASTMSLAADRLERKGLVAREKDPNDRRRVGLVLTEAGQRLRQARSVLDPERVRTMLSHLEPDELDRALEGLALLAAAAERSMRAAAATADSPERFS